jgi:hypothetical protein
MCNIADIDTCPELIDSSQGEMSINSLEVQISELTEFKILG